MLNAIVVMNLDALVGTAVKANAGFVALRTTRQLTYADARDPDAQNLSFILRYRQIKQTATHFMKVFR